MKPRLLTASALLALCLPALSQSTTWETGTGTQGNDDFGNELVFANGINGFTATAWSHTGGKRGQSFEAAQGVSYSSGIGVTNQNEGPYRVPEHQIDNARGNDWILIIFDSAVSDVTLMVDPYGTWDRDVTYYTANISGDVDLSGLSYDDLGELGFGERVDDLSTRSSESREISISDEGNSFNAILIGAQQGRPGGPRNVDRFKIGAVGATFVPEPSSALLGGLGALLLLRRRK